MLLEDLGMELKLAGQELACTSVKVPLGAEEDSGIAALFLLYICRLFLLYYCVVIIQQILNTRRIEGD